MVLSQVPTAPLNGATLFFNAPDVNNVLTQVTGGASNVNTSSLTVVSQPPANDGYITTSTTATTGIVNMYQALNPVDSTFTATLAYCAPGFTYPSAGNCTTFTEHYAIAQSQDMGEQIVEIIATENIYEGASQAHFGPTTAAQGQTVTLTEAPPGGAVPTTSSGATVNYIDGDTYIMPIPAGLTYVPGTAHTIGGDAQTSAAGRHDRHLLHCRERRVHRLQLRLGRMPVEGAERERLLPDHLPLPRRAIRHRDGQPGQGWGAAPVAGHPGPVRGQRRPGFGAEPAHH